MMHLYVLASPAEPGRFTAHPQPSAAGLFLHRLALPPRARGSTGRVWYEVGPNDEPFEVCAMRLPAGIWQIDPNPDCPLFSFDRPVVGFTRGRVHVETSGEIAQLALVFTNADGVRAGNWSHCPGQLIPELLRFDDG